MLAKAQRLVLVSCFLGVLSLALAGGACASEPSPSENTGVTLVGATPKAEVQVDGEKVGVTPLPGSVPLAAGEHTIRVMRPGFAPYIDVFKVREGKITKLEVELVPIAGVLTVKANVDKARVFVDGKFVGETPVTVETKVGPHEVRVSHFGYNEVKLNFSAVAGEVVDKDLQMTELPVGQNPYKPATAAPKWYEKWWVWTIGATAVAAIAVAVIVPTVYYSRGVCQRLDAEVCIPISSGGTTTTGGTMGLTDTLSRTPAPTLGLTLRF